MRFLILQWSPDVIDKSLLSLILLVPFFNFHSYSSYTLQWYIWIWYNVLHIYQSKSKVTGVSYNTNFIIIDKVSPTIVTRVLKTNSMMFWYSTNIINTQKNLVIIWIWSTVHTDHFQVAQTHSTLCDLVNTEKLNRY